MLEIPSQEKINQLQEKAKEVRKLIIRTLQTAGSGHSAGSLGMADIFTALYFHILNQDPTKPEDKNRDFLILSNGHICPVQYAVLALSGYFPVEELKTLRKIDSRLQGHPHRGSPPGIETTSGPLGEGLSQAIGVALTQILDKKESRVYCITSDGEHDEGNTWEAVMFAGKNKLKNLINIIDRNNIQIGGKTEEVMPLEPLKEKYLAYNWNVLQAEGNDIKDFIEKIITAQESDKPTAVIALNVPGKGVSFMENDSRWHGKAPNKQEADRAIKEIENA